jgi:hypothetical protein
MEPNAKAVWQFLERRVAAGDLKNYVTDRGELVRGMDGAATLRLELVVDEELLTAFNWPRKEN